MMERYYDAHLYLTNWGTHQVMLRLPRALLNLKVTEQYCIDLKVTEQYCIDLKVTEQYCIDPHVTAWVSGEHLILDLISEDDSGDWIEGAEDSPSAIVGIRAELVARDLRPLYLAWLAAYGIWERNEDAFDYDEENDLEPPVPDDLETLTAPQRALADFLRLDNDLLTTAAQASPPLTEAKDDPARLANWIKDLPGSDKDKLLHRVAQGHGAQVQMELRRRFRGHPDPARGTCPRRTVAELLDAATETRHERERRAEATRTALEARQARERELAREKRLDVLARNPEPAWAQIETLIDTRKPSDYDIAVELLKDLQALAQRDERAEEFTQRFGLLRQQHHRKPSLITRFDQAGLPATPISQKSDPAPRPQWLLSPRLQGTLQARNGDGRPDPRLPAVAQPGPARRCHAWLCDTDGTRTPVMDLVKPGHSRFLVIADEDGNDWCGRRCSKTTATLGHEEGQRHDSLAKPKRPKAAPRAGKGTNGTS